MLLWQNSKRLFLAIKMVAIIAALTFVLGGCKGAFAGNPVVQHMKHGATKIDLTLEDMDNILDQYQPQDFYPPTEEPVDEFLAEKEVFYRFIDKIRQASTVQYENTRSHSSELDDIMKSNLKEFLASDSLFVTERQPTDFVITNTQATRRVLSLDAQVSLINLEDATNTSYALQHIDSKDLLFEIVKGELPIVSVGTEEISGELYTIYMVEENSGYVKWYFTAEGILSLRVYTLNDISEAVKYENIDFAPIVPKDLFSLTGTTQSSEPSSTDESSAESSIESSTESSKPESSEPSASSSQAPSQPPASSQPASSQPVVPPPVVPPPVSPEPSAPSSSSSLPDSSSKPPVSKEEPPKSLVPNNYPHNQVPLIKGYNVSSASDDSSGTKRVISLNGSLVTSFSGTSSYYTSVLNGAPDFTSREMFDESDGYTYTLLRGTVDGWEASIEIAEAHATGKCTMTLTVKR